MWIDVASLSTSSHDALMLRLCSPPFMHRLVQKTMQILAAHGARQEVSLQLVAAHGEKHVSLLYGLHALCGELHFHGAPEIDYGADDAVDFLVTPQLCGERMVDFKFVDAVS